MVMDPRKEPSAGVRHGAAAMFEMFNALMLEGFTEPQALTILGVILQGQIAKGGEG